MDKKQNISQVVTQKLCNTCGACSAVCKTGAVSYRETVGGYLFPFVDRDKCTECGLCLSVCPGAGFSQELKDRMPADPFAGHALKSFVGKASDRKIYENAQSGGLVSLLLIHALQSGAADAAVTVRMEWGRPPRPRAYLAKSAEEILLSQKSKYGPVPVLSLLRELIHSNQKIVFAGTSCQVHGLLNIMYRIPKVKDNVCLIIGLVCDRVMTYAAADYLIHQTRLDETEMKYLDFRDKSCGGYPGNVHIRSYDGQDFVLSARSRMRIKDFFTPVRCRLCFDKMNIFSDIVAGDPHGIRNTDREMGESIAVIRTDRGQKFFHQLMESKSFSAREIPCQDILAGQSMESKRREWSGYTAAWKKTGLPVPDYGIRIPEKSAGSDKFFLKHLAYSLSLDNHPSREALLRFTEKQLFRKKAAEFLYWPAKSVKNLTKRIYKSIMGN